MTLAMAGRFTNAPAAMARKKLALSIFRSAAVLILIVGAVCPGADEPKPATPVAAPSAANDIREADALADQGIKTMTASNDNPSLMVDAALTFTRALKLYESAQAFDQARGMQANIFWCKKRMNRDDLQRFVEAKRADPDMAAIIDRMNQVADQVVPKEQADAYLAEADAFAAGHADAPLLVAIRYFEVAERFAGTPASLKAQRMSLDAQQAHLGAIQLSKDQKRQTLFTRPARAIDGKRDAVPSLPDQKAGRETLKKLFKDDMGRKDGRQAFAWKLHEQALATKDDPKLRHAMLSEALATAIAVQDINGILVFCDALAERYEGVDATAEKKTALTRIKTNPAAGAILKLLDNPGDTASNTIAGRYFAIDCRLWDIGLPLLTAGADAGLAKLAEMELAAPDGSSQQMELGDAWFALGNPRNATGVACWERAMHWYKLALPGLSGASKTQVEQHLDDMFGVVDDPDINWDKLTATQWDKLKGVVYEVQAVRNKTDSPVVLKPGQRARVVPHPTDTWGFQSYWTNGVKLLDYRGEKRTRRFINEEDMVLGQMWCQVVDNDHKMMNTVLTGPGKITCGPQDASYANKGVIRVKIILLD